MPSQGYHIRPAAVADLAAVRDVLVTTWHDTYDAIDGPEAVTRITDLWHSVAVLNAQLTNSRHQPSVFLVATERQTGQIVATSLAHLEPDGATVMLARLYCRPEHQRTGLGSRLLQVTLASFATARRVQLEVAPQNARAIAFYRAQGYSQVSTTQNCGEPGSGLAALIFEKTL
jgi:GNAT superfamily N-acetyltransferase